MRKTWTTRILIALMTLAIVAGVFGAAPREAQAAGEYVLSADKTEVVDNESIHFTMAPANASYWYLFIKDGTAEPTRTKTNTIDYTFATMGEHTVQCRVYNAETDGQELGSDAKTIKVKHQPDSVTSPNTTSAAYNSSVNLQFSATGGYPADYTYSLTSGTLPSDYSLNTATGAITGTAKTAISNIVVSATNGVGGLVASGNYSLSISKNTPTLSLSGGTVSIGETIKLTATGVPDDAGGTYEWLDGSTPLTSTSKTCVFPESSTTTLGDHTIKVTWRAPAGSTSYNDSNPATAIVKVNSQKLTVSIEPFPNGSYATGTTIYLRGSANPSTGTTYKWTQTGGANAIKDDTSNLGASYLVSQSDLGKTITFTLTASNTNYTSGSANASVNIYSDDYVSSPTTSSMTFNTATLYDTQSFYATTYRGGQMVISNSNPDIATVTAGGQTIGTTGVTIANNTQVTIKAKAYGRTYVDIVPVNGTNSNGKRVTVYVGSQTPTLDVQFWSCDYCTTTLTKVNNWGTLKITVDNYNPSYPYVTVTRSNIRTYVQGGSYYSHPSTYTYTAALTQDLTDPLKATATLYIIPQYNGSTYYSAAYTGAVTKNSPTIYVTGYTTLPQTGPNYTWAYVLGGLCLATVATAVTLNVRKKKRESI